MRLGNYSRIEKLLLTWVEAEAIRYEEEYGDYDMADQVRMNNKEHLTEGTRIFLESDFDWGPAEATRILDSLDILDCYLKRIAPGDFCDGEYFIMPILREVISSRSTTGTC